MRKVESQAIASNAASSSLHAAKTSARARLPCPKGPHRPYQLTPLTGDAKRQPFDDRDPWLRRRSPPPGRRQPSNNADR